MVIHSDPYKIKSVRQRLLNAKLAEETAGAGGWIFESTTTTFKLTAIPAITSDPLLGLLDRIMIDDIWEWKSNNQIKGMIRKELITNDSTESKEIRGLFCKHIKVLARLNTIEDISAFIRAADNGMYTKYMALVNTQNFQRLSNYLCSKYVEATEDELLEILGE